MIFFGARDVTMGQIAAALSSTSDAGGLMVDQTGLEGRLDFSLNGRGSQRTVSPLIQRERHFGMLSRINLVREATHSAGAASDND